MKNIYSTQLSKTEQTNTTQHNTTEIDAKPYSIFNPAIVFQNVWDMKYLWRISKQVLFPRNKFPFLFTNFRSERNEPVSRFLSIFTNLRLESNNVTQRDELNARFFVIFASFRPNVRPQKSYCSIFGYFLDYQTGKEWNNCPIFAHFYEF